MVEPPSQDITLLLLECSEGNKQALDRLIPVVHSELRELARGYMRRERLDHTLQTTALVNEAYLRLIDQKRVRWQNRAHFLGIAAQVMRRILVDHARKHRADKRGGGRADVSFDEAVGAGRAPDVNLVWLDDALTALAALDARQARIVELKYFLDMTIEEIAGLMNISPATVKREWATAKVWLRRELAEKSSK